MKYYAITCIRGHMGMCYDHSTITFYIQARDIISAMNVARRMGGVKHSRMPLNCKEVSKEEFERNKSENAYYRAMAK